MLSFLEEIEKKSGSSLFTISGTSLNWRDTLSAARRVAGYCQRNGEVYATLLSNDHASAAFLMGGLRAGVDVCSLHLPHRGQDLTSYARDIKHTMERVGASRLYVSKQIKTLFDGSGVEVCDMSDALSGLECAEIKDGGRLVQFTSGSTADPSPVPLDSEKIGANVRAIMQRIETDDMERWRASSWLPLSHDMGACGMLLCSWYVGAPFVLRDPLEFMSDPMVWLRDVSDNRSVVTAAPNFALPLVLRALKRDGRGVDLSSLKALILGGEMNRPSDVRRFYEALAPYGLSTKAICPAYGMAEAVLAVSIDSPDTEASIALLKRGDAEDPTRISPSDLEYRSVFAKDDVREDEVEIMSAGRHLEGYVVERGGDSVLSVDGPSLFDGYLYRDGGLAKRSGAHVTRDLGFVADEHVYPLGRADEIIVVRGRNIAPGVVESAAWGAARAGLAAAVPDGEGGLTVVIEVSSESDPRESVQEVRRQVTQAVGVGPTRVLIVAPGSLPKTASGKLRRREIANRALSGDFETVLDHRFGRKLGA